MIQPKNFVAAFAFVGLLTTSGIVNAEVPDLYVEAGYTWVNPGDIDAEFTSENLNANWDLSDMIGGKLQVGIDFGNFRLDGKLRIYEGDIDAITGVTAVNVCSGLANTGFPKLRGQCDPEGPQAVVGVGTINAY